MSGFYWHTDWMPWFAYRPVPMTNGRMAWLKIVERRTGSAPGLWGDKSEYRPLTTAPKGAASDV